jgi:hypothetical protein
MPTWKKSLPDDTVKISDLPTIHSDNFTTTENAYDYEHYSPASANATSGSHKLSIVGAMKIGPTTAITGLTTETGALAFDTTLGILVYYTGTAWQRVTQTYYSRMRAYRSANIAVTSAASAEILVYDTENYDTLSEYASASGVFTALASGYYAIIASVGLASSATVTSTKIVSATGQTSASWTPSTGQNWQTVDEYPTAVDTDYNITATVNKSDVLSGVAAAIPSGESTISVRVHFRAKEASGSCVCNLACYSESCACDGECYGYTCNCNTQCHGYSACSCDYTCDGDYGKGGCITCYALCYGYSSCSCNFSCDVQTCTCQTGYGPGACGCNIALYLDNETKPSGLLRYGGTDYFTGQTSLTSAFADYTAIWATNPATTGAWTSAEVSAISGFGYRTTVASAGCSAQISQAYLTVDWTPARPIFTVYLYKNGTAIESSQIPIVEAGSTSNQTVKLVSIVKLDPSDTLDIRYTKTRFNDTIVGDSAYTYLAIHRLGGQGF